MNDSTSPALKLILAGGVIAIIRASDPAGLLQAATALALGGLTALEFTLNTPGAPGLIGAARATLDGKTLVGAGTVLNPHMAQEALNAGAQFLVTPLLDRAVIEKARLAGVPVVIGAYTPTEINQAWEWGADLVKLFPASAGGLAYLKAIRGPLPHIRLVPTGGVGVENAHDYICAGASALAIGGSLVDPQAIAVGNYQILTSAASKLLSIVAHARASCAKGNTDDHR